MKSQPLNSHIEKAEHISRCLELGILLEVSAYPKPGNVHRTADFSGTRYEHFLASAVAVASHFRYAANRGLQVSVGRIVPSQVEIGSLIQNSVETVNKWQSGGNTLLGAIILLMPIAVAAGMTFTNEKISLVDLRRNLRRIVESSTTRDAIKVYEAIHTAKPSGLGTVPKYDVRDPASKHSILESQVTLFKLFEIASKYDSIASEWINNYQITFDMGYPFFMQQLEETKDINTATVHTFLKILAEIPDTFIARKVGLEKAKKVSKQAHQALRKGGLMNITGKRYLRKLDRELRDPTNNLNPGTTSDIIEAILAISLLNGYRV